MEPTDESVGMENGCVTMSSTAEPASSTHLDSPTVDDELSRQRAKAGLLASLPLQGRRCPLDVSRKSACFGALLSHHNLTAIQLLSPSHCKVKQLGIGAVSFMFTFTFAEEEEEASQSGGPQGQS